MQGRRGEVAVELHTDAPDRFSVGMRLLALHEDGTRAELQVEEFWPHKHWLVLKFAGVDSITDAEALVRCELQVPRPERAELEPGWNYISDLAGCVVFDGEREVGRVQDVRFGAGEAPLLEIASGSKVYEVPFAAAYLRKLDVPGQCIEMDLPEGMLELSAPLTAEEKQAQSEARRSKGR